MKDVSCERIIEAISRAGMEVERLNEDDPMEFLRKREEIIRSTIENFLNIGSDEPLFEVLKESLDNAIKLCPD